MLSIVIFIDSILSNESYYCQNDGHVDEMYVVLYVVHLKSQGNLFDHGQTCHKVTWPFWCSVCLIVRICSILIPTDMPYYLAGWSLLSGAYWSGHCSLLKCTQLPYQRCCHHWRCHHWLLTQHTVMFLWSHMNRIDSPLVFSGSQ